MCSQLVILGQLLRSLQNKKTDVHSAIERKLFSEMSGILGCSVVVNRTFLIYNRCTQATRCGWWGGQDCLNGLFPYTAVTVKISVQELKQL